MSVSVNGVAVATAPEATPEFGAAHELLRQRAIAVGLLEEKSEDEAAIDAAIEALLAREVVTPIPTEEECRRYYDMHQREFTSGVSAVYQAGTYPLAKRGRSISKAETPPLRTMSRRCRSSGSPLAVPGVDLGHKDGSERELPFPSLPRQFAQIATSGLNRRTSLQQASHYHRRLRLAHHRSRLLPGCRQPS
jgi:hypothetical protein